MASHEAGVTRYAEQAADERVLDFAFGNFVTPTEADLEHPYSVYGYDWCNQRWGTKWEADARVDRISDDEVEYSFDTAWSPPVNVIFAAGRKFPKLTLDLRYGEQGNDFSGRVLMEEGDCADEDEGSWGEYYGEVTTDEEEDMEEAP